VRDAKVRGRKVRATCKHCRSPILIDGTAKPLEPLRLSELPALMGTDAGDDATRVSSRRDFSVHDEATVIGQIPAAALEAERRYAQRTTPPPANEPAAPAVSQPALVERESSPSAPAERVLPPYTTESTRLVTTSRGVLSARPPVPSLETTSQLANDLPPLLDPGRKRTSYLLVALATVIVAAIATVIATR
jgi:hypothetical protein